MNIKPDLKISLVKLNHNDKEVLVTNVDAKPSQEWIDKQELTPQPGVTWKRAFDPSDKYRPKWIQDHTYTVIRDANEDEEYFVRKRMPDYIDAYYLFPNPIREI
jgi:hypothetical protein